MPLFETLDNLSHMPGALHTLYGMPIAPPSFLQEPLRVVPLFETLDDLSNAPDTMRTLLSNDWYRSHIKGVQVGCLVLSIRPVFQVACD